VAERMRAHRLVYAGHLDRLFYHVENHYSR
jgi:hypothetical protein